MGIAPNGVDLAESQRMCRRLARSHYENFLVASILVPRVHRQAMYNVYAFCRTADDLADESPTPEIAKRSIETLQQQLDDTFAGSPPPNMFLALSDSIRRYGMTQQPFDDLLAAFRQDQSKTRYANKSELFDYCECSANPVGQMVLQIAGCDDPSRRLLSDKICTALQLTNFCQDVARDYRIGRIYLPVDDWTNCGVTEPMFAEKTTADPLKHLIEEFCDLAETLFREGSPLYDHVPGWLAADLKLFVGGGMATLDAIRRIDFDVLRERPTVGKFSQLKLLGGTLVRVLSRKRTFGEVSRRS